MNSQNELSNIKKRYLKRFKKTKNISPNIRLFWKNVDNERFEIYKKILLPFLCERKLPSVLEIGATCATNLNRFIELGINKNNIILNNLLPHYHLDRFLPASQLIIGDAASIAYRDKFDIILQSIVFTSILTNELKQKLATNMLNMLKTDGIILWYDFIYDNPYNKDVKGISKKEIKHLFRDAKTIDFYPVTLAPPIAKHVGRLYKLLNFFPFLRTHVVAKISK
ncbi:MAG: SAM-dependent methyltransferase [bacterium]